MTTRTERWPAGVPCWTDLQTPDVGAARTFYGAVLGWDFADTDDEFGGYVMAEVEGRAAAGIGPVQDPNAPSVWTMYLASDDADKTAEAVTAAGGTILFPPADVGPLGRMLVATDPSGGAFGVWAAGAHIGAGVVNQAGALTWEDLRSTDPEAVWAFYRAVFGVETQPLEMAGSDYRTFSLAGEPDKPLGGIGGMMGAEGLPSHWLVYFSVPDVGATVATATERGGTVVAPPFDSPFGTMSGLADPAGAVFWVIEYSGDA